MSSSIDQRREDRAQTQPPKYLNQSHSSHPHKFPKQHYHHDRHSKSSHFHSHRHPPYNHRPPISTAQYPSNTHKSKHHKSGIRSLRIKRFKLHRIKLGSTMQVIGPRGNGKTCLMTEFCFQNKDKFDEVYAWSYTDYMNMELEDFIPRQNIYRRFKEHQMAKLIRRQQEEWRAYKLNKKRGQPARAGKELCFILDDCAFKGDIWSCDTIQEIFYNGRHSHITFVFVTQDAGDLPKKLRGQVDVVFATRELTKVNMKTLYDNYFGIFDYPRDFRKTFQALTQDYQMLVLVKNLCRSTAVEDLVFWYKANLELPDFKMGSAEAWVEAELHLDDQDPEDQARKDEELVKQKVAEAIAAKQPLHQVVQCDSHGRPMSSQRARQHSQRHRRRNRRHRSHISTTSIPNGMARFDASQYRPIFAQPTSTQYITADYSSYPSGTPRVPTVPYVIGF